MAKRNHFGKHGLHNALTPFSKQHQVSTKTEMADAQTNKNNIRTGDIIKDDKKRIQTGSEENLLRKKKVKESETRRAKRPRSRCSILSKNSIRCTEWDQLLDLCKQQSVLPFESAFKWNDYCKLEFLDSGTYSVVFSGHDLSRGKNVVFKAIRIMSKETSHKLFSISTRGYETFQEIIPEIAIAIALSNLHSVVTDDAGREYQTHCFTRLYQAAIVFGEIPNFLYIHPWHTPKYRGHQVKAVERFAANISLPNLYVIIKMKNSGESLWSLMNKKPDPKTGQEALTAQQLESLFLQMIFALGVAEAIYEFEHRDLHICNVLVKHTKKKHIIFKIASVEYAVVSYGIKLCIIDNTFSRMKYRGQTFFSDLSGRLSVIGEAEPPKEPQDFAYYLMYQACHPNWDSTTPQTNLYWLRYFAQEMSNSDIMKASQNKRIRKHLLETADLIVKCTTICELINCKKLRKFCVQTSLGRVHSNISVVGDSKTRLTTKSSQSLLKQESSRDSFTGLHKTESSLTSLQVASREYVSQEKFSKDNHHTVEQPVEKQDSKSTLNRDENPSGGSLQPTESDSTVKRQRE